MSGRRPVRAAAAGAVAAALVTRVARRALPGTPPGADPRWVRTNHRDEPVSMLEGPAVGLGLVVGAAACAIAGAGVGAGAGAGGGARTGGAVRSAAARSAAARSAAARSATAAGAAAVLAGAGAGAFGVVDDLTEDTSTRTKGLRGHLGALAHGHLTTGGLKVLGIGAVAGVAALLVGRARVAEAAAGGPRGTAALRVLDVVADTALVAGAANLVNLLDLRPGRALKASVAASSTLAAVALARTAGAAGTVAGDVATASSGAALLGPVLGAAVAAAPADLGERDMLGDGGANALGAVVGVQAALALPRSARLAVLAGVVALTLASERVSFSAVIDATPALRAVDRWGRRP